MWGLWSPYHLYFRATRQLLDRMQGSSSRNASRTARLSSCFPLPMNAEVSRMTTKERYFLELGSLGYIEGSTIKAETSGQILCHYFGGVPYALPPVGLYRWRKPRPLPDHYRYGTRANPGVYTGATSICPQQAPLTQPDPTVVGEDCLQTNLWLPAGDPPKDGWPVYFYIRKVHPARA